MKTGVITSQQVKAQARELGADLVGVCRAEEVNAHPPDPSVPQTPARLWPECQSLVVLAKRIPWGMLRAQDLMAKLYTPHLVMHDLDHIALDISYFLEDQGYHAFPVPEQQTDVALKRGTYGSLSLRHLAVEAGLGTLGLNMMLLTPRFGPRVYLGAVMTDAPLEPDGLPRHPVCLGVACGRCLLVCPSNAVEHWGLNKRECSRNAQRFGVPSLFRYIDQMREAPPEKRWEMARSIEVVNFWQALRSGTGAYAGCPRCIETCPVGEDYHRHLKERHAVLPEATEEKRARRQAMLHAEERGDKPPGLDVSRRWLGYA